MPFLDALAETPAALGLPSPSDPGHSQSPGPPAFSSRAAPGLPGFPFLLAPKLSCPSHLARGPGRNRSPRVTPFSGTPDTPVSPRTYPSHTGRRAVPQTRAAKRPKGPPGLTRLGLAPAYLATTNSAARSRAALPPAQSARTRRRRRRPRPGPDRGPTRPAVQAPFRWLPSQERRAGVSAPRLPPDLRSALPALTCRCPRPTPVPLPLPRAPVAT